jgi:hypothetical protein
MPKYWFVCFMVWSKFYFFSWFHDEIIVKYVLLLLFDSLNCHTSGSGNVDHSIVLEINHFFCFLLLPLDWPPPKLFLIFAILLFLLESLLFSLAAFLFTCLLPFDFPTTNVIIIFVLILWIYTVVNSSES